MPNVNDGTQIGTTDEIADEYVDPTVGGRRDPDLPATAVKIIRVKVAVGPHGQDWGDAVIEQPLQTESRAERQSLEIQAMQQRDLASLQLTSRAGETITLADARGHHMTNRGVR